MGVSVIRLRQRATTGDTTFWGRFRLLRCYWLRAVTRFPDGRRQGGKCNAG